jgi:hypothetical protein
MYFLKVVVNYVNELNPFFLQEFGGAASPKKSWISEKTIKAMS